MKSLKDVTFEEMALGSEGFRHAVSNFLESVVLIKKQGGHDAASHLMRRIFTDGIDLMKYDPGDEPAMENIQEKTNAK